MAKRSKASQEQRLAYTVLADVESLVAIDTAPQAVCFLTHPDMKGKRLQIDADDGGVARFYVRPRKGAPAIEFALECTVEGASATRYTIALDIGPLPTQQPKSGSSGNTQGLHGTLRPPLAGDPLELSNQTLMQRGYPPRPDPDKAPSRYARWYRQVSAPATTINPRKVAHPEVTFAKAKKPVRSAFQLRSPTLPLPPPLLHSAFNATQDTWSAAILCRPVREFFVIEAEWETPSAFNPIPGPVSPFVLPPLYSAVAEWIGLDNSPTDLYQAGTDSECWNSVNWWTVTIYWAWIQCLPFGAWNVPNFLVAPSDRISASIFVADANGRTWFQNEGAGNGGLTPADNSVWFILHNDNNGAHYFGTIPTAPQTQGRLQSTGFTGTFAEFAIERPTDTTTGDAFPLAAFDNAVMHTCWYSDSNYGYDSWPLDADGSTPFVGTLSYTNMRDFDTGNMLAMSYSFPDPTTSGGYEIYWQWINYY